MKIVGRLLSDESGSPYIALWGSWVPASILITHITLITLTKPSDGSLPSFISMLSSRCGFGTEMVTILGGVEMKEENPNIQSTPTRAYLVLPPISFPLWSVSARLTVQRLPDDGWHATLGIVNSGRNNQK